MRRTTWPVRVVVGALLVAAFLVGGTAFRVWYVARADDRRAGRRRRRARRRPVRRRAQLGPRRPAAARRRRSTTTGWPRGSSPSAAAGPGDAYTEAEAGRRYLDRARGAARAPWSRSGRARDTLGSLRAADARARQDGWDTALVVSDPWHSLRARTMARDSGLQAWTSPTRSGPVVQHARDPGPLHRPGDRRAALLHDHQGAGGHRDHRPGLSTGHGPTTARTTRPRRRPRAAEGRPGTAGAARSPVTGPACCTPRRCAGSPGRRRWSGRGRAPRSAASRGPG